MPRYSGLESYLGGSGGGASHLGFTTGGRLPSAQEAPDAQLGAQQNVAQYRDRLARGAFETYRQGAETFSAYRPGGAAALTSGMFGGMAQSLLAARDVQAPDLMFRYQEARARELERQQKKRSRWGSIGAAIGGIAGTIIAPGVGTALGASIGGSLGSEGGALFARGGIVLPRPGGVQGETPGGNKATYAEAGQPEVVVPLEKMGEVARDYEQATGGQPQQPQQGQQPAQQQSGMPGPGAPPPLGRESPDQQRAGQPADEMQAQQAGVPQMGANAGYIGEAFPRQPDDPGADAYGTVGAAHYASQRLGAPADVIQALLLADDMDNDPQYMSPGAAANSRLDYLFDMDEMTSVGVL